MKKIAIFGAGGFGKELACIWFDMLKSQNQVFEFIGFFDDNKVGLKMDYGNVVGNYNDLSCLSEKVEVCFALGNPQTLNNLITPLNNPNLIFPNIIHPTVRFLDSTSILIGKGNVFSMDVMISNNVVINDFNILNTRVTLGHDVKINCFNVLNPNVQISGEVSIGNKNLFGFNSGISQTRKIGDGNVLGAGSILIRNINDNSTYIGVPAKKFSI
jgi:sugar O-acyltransferase (sialic acid O-acetyltransferase NeuD family)